MYEAHYERVLAYALRRSDRGIAEDVVAETFLTAWRRFEQLPDEPLPWLLGVARRILANQRRGAGRRDAIIERVVSLPLGQVEDPAESVAARVEIVRALNRLSEGDREVLTLMAWEALPAADVARVLGCSEGTVWVRLHRARKRLARELERLDMEAPDPSLDQVQVDSG